MTAVWVLVRLLRSAMIVLCFVGVLLGWGGSWLDLWNIASYGAFAAYLTLDGLADDLDPRPVAAGSTEDSERVRS